MKRVVLKPEDFKHEGYLKKFKERVKEKKETNNSSSDCVYHTLVEGCEARTFIAKYCSSKTCSQCMSELLEILTLKDKKNNLENW